MSVSPITSDPYAYLDRNFAGLSGMPRYQAEASPSGPAKTADGSSDFSMFGKDGFGFDDFLDIINPLQHIPVVSSLYRNVTGDEISAGSRMIGGGLFGGVVGFAASVVNTAIESETGKDMGDHVLAMFSDEPTDILAKADPASVEVGDTTSETLPKQPEMARQGPQETSQPPSIKTQDLAALAAAFGPKGATIVPVPDDVGAAQPASHPAQQVAAGAEAEDDGIDSKTGPAAPLPMGLQWKGPPPDLGRSLGHLQSLEDKALTEQQMHQILSHFQNGTTGPARKAEPVTQPSATAKEASAPAPAAALRAYETHTSSRDYEYMNRTI
ncbi:hypothetical protein [Sneathiella chinensis]|uniref:Uncharacterized protein n=1 Tax=Sneathiella chinensis TaxID=349750 RepID=A0ABQ5TZR3_9PROT|nr:hypothetical protein [Sneathiella chinensis]GLQ04963.1 hypothetical protein GCM10007924_01840 [Sneathiella chinensis]